MRPALVWGAILQSVNLSSRWELLCYLIDPVGIERNMPLDLHNSRKRILVRPHRIDGLLSSSGNAVVIAIAFIRTVGSVIQSGLNRAILDASPFELRRQLEYKTQWRGGLLVAVPPQNTSRKCPECQHIAAENRKTQAKFVCVECGFRAPADYVGAVNIKEAGFALLG